MKKRIQMIMCFLLLSMTLAGCSKEVTVDTDDLENLTLDGDDTAMTKKEYTATLTPDDYYALPKSITIEIDGTEQTDGYTYDSSTGELVIEADILTGEVTISAEAKAIEVDVDTDTLFNLTLEDESDAMMMHAYEATLVPAKGCELPEEITVTVAGSELTDEYIYDNTTGKLTINKSAITGDIAISASAVVDIVGTWEGTVDMSDIINDALAADPTMAGYFSFSDISFKIILTFDENANFTMRGDEASFQNTMDNLKEQMADGMRKYFEDYLAASNINMSVDDLLAFSGISIDELIQEAFEESMPDDMLEELETECKYTIIGDTMFLGDYVDPEADSFECNPFSINGNTLTIEVTPEDDGDTFMDYLFPLVLERVN